MFEMWTYDPDCPPVSTAMPSYPLSRSFSRQRLGQLGDVTSIPGIGDKYAARLNAVGISPRKMFGFFLRQKFLWDGIVFQSQYENVTGASKEDSTTTYLAMREWVDKNVSDDRSPYCYCHNDSLLWNMMSTDEKRSKLTSEVIGNKSVCAISGISENLGKRLASRGWPLARHMLGEFLVRGRYFEIWFLKTSMVDGEPDGETNLDDANLCREDLQNYVEKCM